MQRIKPIVLFALLSTVGACDKLDGFESFDQVHVGDSNGPSASCDGGPHPHETCGPAHPDDPVPELHPACVVGCGQGVMPDGHGYQWCGIPCEVAADCEAYAGDGTSVITCDGICHYLCDDDHLCPSGLECFSRGDPPIGGWDFPGECMAPIFIPPDMDE